MRQRDSAVEAGQRFTNDRKTPCFRNNNKALQYIAARSQAVDDTRADAHREQIEPLRQAGQIVRQPQQLFVSPTAFLEIKADRTMRSIE